MLVPDLIQFSNLFMCAWLIHYRCFVSSVAAPTPTVS